MAVLVGVQALLVLQAVTRLRIRAMDVRAAVEDALLHQGGRHQRLAAAAREQGGAAAPAHSILTDALLNLVGWGILSSVTASMLARCALADGADHAELRALGSIGSDGTWVSNSRRATC